MASQQWLQSSYTSAASSTRTADAVASRRGRSHMYLGHGCEHRRYYDLPLGHTARYAGCCSQDPIRPLAKTSEVFVMHMAACVFTCSAQLHSLFVRVKRRMAYGISCGPYGGEHTRGRGSQHGRAGHSLFFLQGSVLRILDRGRDYADVNSLLCAARGAGARSQRYA